MIHIMSPICPVWLIENRNDSFSQTTYNYNNKILINIFFMWTWISEFDLEIKIASFCFQPFRIEWRILKYTILSIKVGDSVRSDNCEVVMKAGRPPFLPGRKNCLLSLIRDEAVLIWRSTRFIEFGKVREGQLRQKKMSNQRRKHEGVIESLKIKTTPPDASKKVFEESKAN